jgi:hypothetical protein
MNARALVAKRKFFMKCSRDACVALARARREGNLVLLVFYDSL